MNNLFLLVLVFLFTATIFADHHGDKKKMKAGMEERAMMARLRMDLAELKGPPTVEEVLEKKAKRLADLDLLIASGNYEGMRLQRLEQLRDRVATSEDPSQDQINKRHQQRLKLAKNKLKEGNRQKEKARKQKSKYRKKD